MVIAITSDTDFVSDEILNDAYSIFKNIPLTIFQTNPSEFLKRNAKENNWELEVHPNFCEKSTHGNSVNEVITNCDDFKGEAIGFRCHKYYSSNDVVEQYKLKGYKYSSNICTDLNYISPFYDRAGILNFPIFFEDGGYLKYHGVPNFNFIKTKLVQNEICVLNFHPIHITLNTSDFYKIRELKDSVPANKYASLTTKDIAHLINQNYGIKNFIIELLEYSKNNNVELLTLRECYERYKDFCF